MSAKASPRLPGLPRDVDGRLLEIGDRVESVALVDTPDGFRKQRGLVIDHLSAERIRIELDDDGYPEIDAPSWSFRRLHLRVAS